jgi:hypothetical protein
VSGAHVNPDIVNSCLFTTPRVVPIHTPTDAAVFSFEKENQSDIYQPDI